MVQYGTRSSVVRIPVERPIIGPNTLLDGFDNSNFTVPIR